MGYRKRFSERIANYIIKQLEGMESDELKEHLRDTSDLNEENGRMEYGLKEVLMDAIQNQLEINKEILKRERFLKSVEDKE